MYQPLTDYLPEIEREGFGNWIIDKYNDGTPENPIQMPYIEYSQIIRRFIHDVYSFQENHPEYGLNRYSDILKENNLEWGKESMQKADVSTLGGKCIMALLVAAVRADRFCEGALLSFFRNGDITKWLLRLKEIDS